jgi:hypothetical protein
MTRGTRKRGGASIGQPPSFFTGGFLPSLMGGVLQNGPYLLTAATTLGSRLIKRSRERMSARKKGTRTRRRRRHTVKA